MAESFLTHAETSKAVITAFYKVHRTMRFGHREHTYMNALANELSIQGNRVAREVNVPIFCKTGFELRREFAIQFFSYLHCSRLEVALLLHFGPKATFKRFFASNLRKPHGGP